MAQEVRSKKKYATPMGDLPGDLPGGGEPAPDAPAQGGPAAAPPPMPAVAPGFNPPAPADAGGGGYANPGAMLPGAAAPAPASTGPLTATLTQQMLERPTAADKQAEYQAFAAKMPRNVSFTRAPEGSLGSFNAAGGFFTPDPDAQMQDRSLGAFGALDRMAGGSEEMALKKFLGVGGLGVQTGNLGVNVGQLGVAQRGQQASEVKLAHDIGMDRQGAKAFDLMASQGKGADELKSMMKLRGKFFPPGAGVPGDWQAGGPFAAAPGLQGLGGAAPAGGVQRGPGPLAPIGTAPGPQAVSPGERDWSDVIPLQALNEIKALTALDKSANNVGNAAKILSRHMDKPGFEGHLPHMLDYLRTNYGGPALQKFAQPSPVTQLLQRTGNMFGQPSEDEIVASQIRNAMNLPVRGMRVANSFGESKMAEMLGLGQ